MTSTERILEYIDVKPEAPLETDVKPAEDWPDKGRINMQDMSLRYSADGQDVLHNISFSIHSTEKVIICLLSMLWNQQMNTHPYPM